MKIIKQIGIIFAEPGDREDTAVCFPGERDRHGSAARMPYHRAAEDRTHSGKGGFPAGKYGVFLYSRRGEHHQLL